MARLRNKSLQTIDEVKADRKYSLKQARKQAGTPSGEGWRQNAENCKQFLNSLGNTLHDRNLTAAERGRV